MTKQNIKIKMKTENTKQKKTKKILKKKTIIK